VLRRTAPSPCRTNDSPSRSCSLGRMGPQSNRLLRNTIPRRRLRCRPRDIQLSWANATVSTRRRGRRTSEKRKRCPNMAQTSLVGSAHAVQLPSSDASRLPVALPAIVKHQHRAQATNGSMTPSASWALERLGTSLASIGRIKGCKQGPYWRRGAIFPV
jgi:hypothetical protein